MSQNPSSSRKPARRTSARAVRAARPAGESQAGYHIKARTARSTATAEDYVEAIADLIESKGEARITEIARCLGVTHVTVTRIIARMQREGLVTAQPRRSIFLTETGRALAEHVRARHEVVLAFLAAIGVDPETAKVDAEGIEHHVSAQTLAAMERFVRGR